MTPREANVLLTGAALLDGRLRCEPKDRAHMATAWARLMPDIELSAAMWALDAHYREESKRSVMPADIIALAPEAPADDSAGDVDGREWLARRGIDPDEFEARLAAGERPTRALLELGGVVSS